MPVKNSLTSPPSQMRAIAIVGDRYEVVTMPVPVPGRGEALVRVAYAGVNRAELFQLENRYPRPTGDPMVPGLEFAGIIERVNGAGRFKRGDRVCGIVMQGAFAEYCVTPLSTLLPVPKRLSLKEAAALPEAILTTWIALFHQCRLKKGETALIHGGASGVGVAAIQMAKLAGAKVFATAGSTEKCRLCESLGAARAIPYKKEDFEQALQPGVDVILDMVGGDYVQKNLSLLNLYGRLAFVSFLRGAKVDVNLSPILLKKLSVHGSLLRNRPLREKAAFVRAVRQKIWPFVASGRLKPVLDAEFSLEKAALAIEKMQRSLNLGKIVLKVASPQALGIRH